MFLGSSDKDLPRNFLLSLVLKGKIHSKVKIHGLPIMQLWRVH